MKFKSKTPKFFFKTWTPSIHGSFLNSLFFFLTPALTIRLLTRTLAFLLAIAFQAGLGLPSPPPTGVLDSVSSMILQLGLALTDNGKNNKICFELNSSFKNSIPIYQSQHQKSIMGFRSSFGFFHSFKPGFGLLAKYSLQYSFPFPEILDFFFGSKEFPFPCVCKLKS